MGEKTVGLLRSQNAGYDLSWFRKDAEGLYMFEKIADNFHHGEPENIEPGLDDFRGFLPSQAASTAGLGIKTCLLALSSFFVYYTSSLSYSKVHSGISYVRPPFQKPYMTRTWLGRSPRFPHPNFLSKNHADAVYVPRLRLLKHLTQSRHDCVVWRCNKSATWTLPCLWKRLKSCLIYLMFCESKQ